MLMYRDGDATAFDTLYQRHKGPVYRYVLRQCGNAGIAEELFQEIWIKLINARPRYEVKAKFTTYLYQVAHNRIIDHFRSQKANNPGDCDDELDAIPARQQDQPEQRSELQQQSQLLLASVEKLPEEQRQAFLLKEEAGMSIQEIANLTGVNAETAKSRLRYAIRKLRQIMSE